MNSECSIIYFKKLNLVNPMNYWKFSEMKLTKKHYSYYDNLQVCKYKKGIPF
ncbi:hypothetical protein BTS2_2692 [Bacillus sp. TS-2]|nr:hypothetical protein BTS2_2692 [Bacillus sp. TS-2]